MSDAYKYLDSDYTYIDSRTGVLRNLPEIEDAEVLLFVESSAVTKRLQELYSKPVKIKGIETLFEIHRHLFQDVYAWAGRSRKVEISKAGKQFFPTSHFDKALKYLDFLLVEYKNLPKKDTRLIAEKLAEILDYVNYLHPFREGNGRAQREFLRTLALSKGYSLNLNPPNKKSIYERYMEGTVNSDVHVLTDLIHELITQQNG